MAPSFVAPAFLTAVGSFIFLGSFFNGRYPRLIRAANANESDNINALPLVITTWANPGFPEATEEAWGVIEAGGSRLDALTTGCSACERLQCDRTVGFGGSPDEAGETTLDALVMDGPGHRMGAVASLRRIKDAARVARAVMEYTKHSMLVGDAATKFALEMGFNLSDLHTNSSKTVWKNWLGANCQPNFRQNVIPDSKSSCGPYRPVKNFDEGANAQNKVRTIRESESSNGKMLSHDTIGMVIIDKNGDVSAGTSTNGATHKVPGRVGDGPIPGAGAYLDNEVGGAAGTGDGDVMMRFLPSYQAVEFMRHGMDPSSACDNAIRRIAKYYPDFQGAVIAANKKGQHGAACYGIGTFSYCVRNLSTGKYLRVFNVSCVGE